jgi:hypothetical protein
LQNTHSGKAEIVAQRFARAREITVRIDDQPEKLLQQSAVAKPLGETLGPTTGSADFGVVSIAETVPGVGERGAAAGAPRP